jgi:hypothetical protein
MNIELDVALVFDPATTAQVLLSIGYGNGHVVTLVDGSSVVENILAFIAQHRAARGANWIEIGRFDSSSVTLCLDGDSISVIIDSEVNVGGFGQSAGLYIPRSLLDRFVAALTEARRKFTTGPKV